MSFKLLQHRPHWRFPEQQLLVQLENVLQVAAEYAPHELVTYGLPGHSHQPITHGRLRADTTEDQNGSITVYAICQYAISSQYIC
nr:IncI1 plasmid conjugative transfer pilus-tip adhesin protein PilVA [Escherichia coli]